MARTRSLVWVLDGPLGGGTLMTAVLPSPVTVAGAGATVWRCAASARRRLARGAQAGPDVAQHDLVGGAEVVQEEAADALAVCAPSGGGLVDAGLSELSEHAAPV